MDTPRGNKISFHVSTGLLPSSEQMQSLADDACRLFKSNRNGKNSQVYRALARVPEDMFGICVAVPRARSVPSGAPTASQRQDSCLGAGPVRFEAGALMGGKAPGH